MFKRLTILAVAALAVAAVGATAQGAAASVDPVSVDFANCAFGDGTAIVPAGEPITLTDTGSLTEGTYGLALHAAEKISGAATIAVTGGTTTTIPLAYSAPQYFGAPYFAWRSFLPDISLEALAPGGSVLVTIDTTPTTGGETVFPRQKYGAPHFGPFHTSRGDTGELQCLITATS